MRHDRSGVARPARQRRAGQAGLGRALAGVEERVVAGDRDRPPPARRASQLDAGQGRARQVDRPRHQAAGGDQRDDVDRAGGEAGQLQVDAIERAAPRRRREHRAQVGAPAALGAQVGAADDEAAIAELDVAGRDDELTPVALHERMRSLLPDASLTIIEGAGHLSNLEQPDVFNRSLSRFLRSLA